MSFLKQYQNVLGLVVPKLRQGPPDVWHKRTLLVIDVDYADGWSRSLDDKEQRVADSLVECLRNIRQARGNIVFVMFKPNRNASVYQLRGSSICLGCTHTENKLAAFLEHSHNGRFEPVFVKNQCNAFTNPHLGEYLCKLGVRELVLAGCYRDACVLQTARGAVCAGFDVTLLEDCVSPPFPSSEEKQRWLEDVTCPMPACHSFFEMPTIRIISSHDIGKECSA